PTKMNVRERFKPRVSMIDILPLPRAKLKCVRPRRARPEETETTNGRGGVCRAARTRRCSCLGADLLSGDRQLLSLMRKNRDSGTSGKKFCPLVRPASKDLSRPGYDG